MWNRAVSERVRRFGLAPAAGDCVPLPDVAISGAPRVDLRGSVATFRSMPVSRIVSLFKSKKITFIDRIEIKIIVEVFNVITGFESQSAPGMDKMTASILKMFRFHLA